MNCIIYREGGGERVQKYYRKEQKKKGKKMEFKNQKVAEREKVTRLAVGTFAIGKRSNRGKIHRSSLGELCE